MFKKVIGQESNDSIRSPFGQADAISSEKANYEFQNPIARPLTSSSTTQGRNILASDVEIQGILKFQGDLLVDGKIDGEIHSSGVLTVGENSKIRAQIHTGVIVIYGKVHGNITATERVELKAHAEVIGDITASSLVVEADSIFIGKSHVGAPAKVAPLPKEDQSIQASLVSDELLPDSI